ERGGTPPLPSSDHLPGSFPGDSAHKSASGRPRHGDHRHVPTTTPVSLPGSLAEASRGLTVGGPDNPAGLHDSQFVRLIPARGDRRPFNKRCGRAGTPSRYGTRVLQPILPGPQESRRAATNLGFEASKPAPGQVPVQDADGPLHSTMHPSWRLVHNNRPEGRVLPGRSGSKAQTLSKALFPGPCLPVQGPTLRSCPIPSHLYEGCQGRASPARPGRHSDPGLPRRLASHSLVQRPVDPTPGQGAFALKPFGSEGQLGKEPPHPRESHLFSRDGAELREHAGAIIGRTHQGLADRTLRGVLSTSGQTEVNSEAPGAYVSRSPSHSTRAPAYATTAAMASLASSELGMASGSATSGRRSASEVWGASFEPPQPCGGHHRCLQDWLGRRVRFPPRVRCLDRKTLLLA
ncbi:hypothetical protein DNTS_001585, partial [Danionella cerebrum]